MSIPIKLNLKIQPEIKAALSEGAPVLALESTILSHGMPYPQNLEFAHKAGAVARKIGAVPAAIAVVNGAVCVGLDDSALELLCNGENVIKLAANDIGWALVKNKTGGTTVSATITLAQISGIPVFATGGIGGVHREVETSFDISQDLAALSTTSIIVVSSGAKAVLDLPKTLEYLETAGVPVCGYNTDQFPAFYSRSSGLSLEKTISTPEEAARCFIHHSNLGTKSALLVVNPIPEESEISTEEINNFIVEVLNEALEKKIGGKKLTPFLLNRLAQKTGGRSLEANIALALNNVKLGSEIACEYQKLIAR